MNAAARKCHHSGVEACRQGRFEQGIGHFKAAIHAAPEVAEYHQWLISAMLAWARLQPVTPEAAVERAPLPFFTVVVCSINPQKFLRLKKNIESLIPENRLQIIRIPDARSMSEGYNRGARQAKGDIVVFCHDDIEILTPDFAARVADRLDQFDLLGVAGSTWLRDANWSSAGFPYLRGQVVHALTDRKGFTYSVFGLDGVTSDGIQALDGLFLAMRRDFCAANRFDEAYDNFHLYDIDLSFRCHLAGHRVAVCNDILIEHHSLGRFDASWKRAAEIFGARLGDRLEARPKGIDVCSNFRLDDLEQVLQLYRALRHFGYGTDVRNDMIASGPARISE